MHLHLIIEEGLHRGARVPLPSGRHSIGSGRDDDVLLTDDALVPGHLVLEIGPQGCDLHIAGDGVIFPGHDLSAPVGETWRVSAQALESGAQTLRVAGVLLRLECDAQAGLPEQMLQGPGDGRAASLEALMRLSRHPAAMVTAVAVAASLLAGLGAVASWPSAPQLAQKPPPAVAPDLQTQFAGQDRWRHLRVVKDSATGRTQLLGSVDDRHVLQEALRLPDFEQQEPAVKVVVKDELIRHVGQALQDTQLTMALEPATESSVARLVVSGSTTRPGVPSLLKMLKEEWTGRVEIVDRTAYAPAAGQLRTVRVEMPIRIAAVNVSERYIEASNGIRYFEGSSVGRDQTVKSIGSERVVFDIAGRQIEFRLP